MTGALSGIVHPRERLRSLLESRYRISTQIYLAFGGVVALTIAASLVGWFSFDRVGDQQARVNDGSVPEMTAAFGMAQHANTLVSAGPRLAATTNQGDAEVVAADITEAYVGLVGELALLRGQDAGDQRFSSMRSYVDSLLANTTEIQEGVSESFARADRLERLRVEIEDVDRQLKAVLLPAADNQLFYSMTGYENFDDQPAASDRRLTEDQFFRYRHLVSLVVDSNTATQSLATAFGTAAGSATLDPLSERFQSAVDRMNHSLRALDELEGPDGQSVDIDTLIAGLTELGTGSQGAIDLLRDEFELRERRAKLLSENRGIAVALLSEVDAFVAIANTSVQDAALASGDAVFTGKVLLATLSVASVGGAAFIAWLFIGRVLLSRLGKLLVSMRQMAGGDLDVEVDTAGRDEVADMAEALEVFRKAAQDALELDEVRRLNDQLEQTNVALAATVEQRDGALDDLQEAQDQIVARDKLAALGELTAGVAHEIRNPLNFVKNFSEGSEELLEELAEILEEISGSLPEEQRDLIVEISGELGTSLDRIRSNTGRADRIVEDMLRMGRDVSEAQLTDINGLLDEHARLAFHSARAVDPSFQLDLVQDLDPEVGEIEVVPQELGRVIVNLVTNAGYATNEKRLESGETTFDSDSYMPTVWLSTRRRDDHIEISIRDNANGIPDDTIDKIFNPFFTTKPPNEGTGLGLAMCNDIIRGHGGSIRVETELGQGTEMIVEIPLTRPVEVESAPTPA